MEFAVLAQLHAQHVKILRLNAQHAQVRFSFEEILAAIVHARHALAHKRMNVAHVLMECTYRIIPANHAMEAARSVTKLRLNARNVRAHYA